MCSIIAAPHITLILNGISNPTRRFPPFLFLLPLRARRLHALPRARARVRQARDHARRRCSRASGQPRSAPGRRRLHHQSGRVLGQAPEHSVVPHNKILFGRRVQGHLPELAAARGQRTARMAETAAAGRRTVCRAAGAALVRIGGIICRVRRWIGLVVRVELSALSLACVDFDIHLFPM